VTSEEGVTGGGGGELVCSFRLGESVCVGFTCEN
jgi:hypothetical protein